MTLSVIVRLSRRLFSSSIFLFFFLFVALGFSACSGLQSTPALIPITVQFSWLHQEQFAGLYAADKQGFFVEEGLDVSFREGGLTEPLDLEQVYTMQFLEEIYSQ